MGFASVTSENAWLQVPDETLARYNCYDLVHTAQLVPHLKRELTARGQWKFWTERFLPMIPVVRAMQARGVGVLDRDLRTRARRWVKAAIDDVESAVWRHVGEGYNRDTFFDSHKQLGRFLYGDLGLKAPPRTQKRAANSSNQQALTFVLSHLRKADEHARPIIHDLFHRSRLATILERYLTIEGDSDGRIRPTIKLYGARTGRLAYAGLPGEAIQQWPEECRSLIRAAPGCVFVSRDYSQIEARILAYLSHDRASIEVFESGGNIHSQNAADLFEAKYQVAKTDPEYDFAKKFLYGISYGGEAESMNVQLFCPCWRCTADAPPQINLSRAEIKAAADRWKAKHQPVFDYRDALLESVKGYGANHTYVSPFDCHRTFMEPREVCKRSLWDYPMQHCAAMIINDAMVRLHERGAPITLQMHDSLTLEVPTNDADHWDTLLHNEMEQPVTELGGVVFPTSASRGDTWGAL